MNWSAELYTKTGLGTLLEEALSQGATEVHFKVPKPVLFRVDGVLIDTPSPVVRPQTTNQIGASLCALAGRSEDITVVRDLEFSFGMMGIGRFHVVLYRQRGTLGIIVRPASFHSPTLDSLGLDSATIAPYLQRPGLIVVMGTTHTQPYLAALVQQFNETSPGFVVTIADPITHLFRDQLATIAQHDIGTDTHSFADGVSHASRRGADLIVPFTVNNFETGHSVLQAVEYGSTLIIGLPVSNSSEIADWFCRTQPSQHNTTRERVEKALTLTIGVNSEGSPSLTRHN
jgi:twitching motility protein PilT